MSTSAAYAAKNKIRKEGLKQQYLIPIKPGWWNLHAHAPPNTKPFTSFTEDTAWSTPSGLVGGAVAGSRVGQTSGSEEQIKGWVHDDCFGGQRQVAVYGRKS
jgi:hypothetical protein